MKDAVLLIRVYIRSFAAILMLPCVVAAPQFNSEDRFMGRERKMVRKPALKFPQLRKKMEQAKLRSRVRTKSKQK
jgi:hypothetical protein